MIFENLKVFEIHNAIDSLKDTDPHLALRYAKRAYELSKLSDSKNEEIRALNQMAAIHKLSKNWAELLE